MEDWWVEQGKGVGGTNVLVLTLYGRWRERRASSEFAATVAVKQRDNLFGAENRTAGWQCRLSDRSSRYAATRKARKQQLRLLPSLHQLATPTKWSAWAAIGDSRVAGHTSRDSRD